MPNSQSLPGQQPSKPAQLAQLLLAPAQGSCWPSLRQQLEETHPRHCDWPFVQGSSLKTGSSSVLCAEWLEVLQSLISLCCEPGQFPHWLWNKCKMVFTALQTAQQNSSQNHTRCLYFGLIAKWNTLKPSFGTVEPYSAATVKAIYFTPGTWLLDMVLTAAAFLQHVLWVPDISAPLF